MRSYPAIKKNEILSLVAKWMKPEDIMLSEISHRQTEHLMFSVICGSQKNKIGKVDKGRLDLISSH
jgi:hypothetical protein